MHNSLKSAIIASQSQKIPEGYGGCMSTLYTNRVMTGTSGHRSSSFIQLRYRNTSFPTLAVSNIPQSPGLREMWGPLCTTLGPTHPGHSRVTRWHWVLWLRENHNLTPESSHLMAPCLGFFLTSGVTLLVSGVVSQPPFSTKNTFIHQNILQISHITAIFLVPIDCKKMQNKTKQNTYQKS